VPTCDLEKRAYRPRRAQESPLYKIVLDEIESFVVQTDESDERPAANVENSLRAFLECGILKWMELNQGIQRIEEKTYSGFTQRSRRSQMTAQPIGDRKTYAIIGAAIEVHRVLGSGFLEQVYQEALALEFTKRSIPFRREAELPVSYKGQQLGAPYKADFIVYESVVVELKAISRTTDNHGAQVVHYLKAANLTTGLLLNFGQDLLAQKRFVYTPSPSSAPSVTSA